MKLTNIILLLLTLPIIAANPNGEPTILLWAGDDPSANKTFTINIPGDVCAGDELNYSQDLDGAINAVNTYLVLEEDESTICKTSLFDDVNFKPPVTTVPNGLGPGSSDIVVRVPWDWTNSEIKRGSTSGEGITEVTLNFVIADTDTRIVENTENLSDGVMAAQVASEIDEIFSGIAIDAAGARDTLCDQLVKWGRGKTDGVYHESSLTAIANKALQKLNTHINNAQQELEEAILNAGDTATKRLESRIRTRRSSFRYIGKYEFCEARFSQGSPGWTKINNSVIGIRRLGDGASLSFDCPLDVSASVSVKSGIFGSVSLDFSTSGRFAFSAATNINVEIEVISDDNFNPVDAPSTVVMVKSNTTYDGTVAFSGQQGMLGVGVDGIITVVQVNPTVSIPLEATE